MKEKTKIKVWAAVYGGLLTAFTVFVLLDTFVIPRSYASAAEMEYQDGESPEQEPGSMTEQEPGSGESGSGEERTVQVTETSYVDDQMTIKIETYREYDTDIYVAEVILKSPESLRTALAADTYGRNITAATSEIARAQGGILAVNGDFYGAQNDGYVIRNGVLYREEQRQADQEDLVIYGDGRMEVVRESEASAKELLEAGAWQVLSFGPGLVEGGEIQVSENDEVGKAMASNPRTAIAMIEPLHYLFVVSDGRTDESRGLSLYELAEFLSGFSVSCAYNLDGGGSSTMYFNGRIVNTPTTWGGRVQERSVSDIVYIR